ncbi:hypothetical protein Tco_1365715, partial [Tanacetum coccineum]
MLTVLSLSGRTLGSRLTPEKAANKILGILKFTNKEAKDPVFGMAILNVMLSDEIKAFNDYSEYLAKSLGTQLAKGREQDEIPLVRRQTGVFISRQVQRESTKANLDQSSKLKGLETIFEAAQFKLDMKKAIKASKDDFIFQQRPRGSGVTPTVLDEPSGNSSSSSSYSDDEIKDIYSDEDDKAAKEKDADKHVADNQPMDEQAEKVQVEKSVPKPQVEKPAVPYPKPIKTEVISMVEVPVTQETPAAQRPPLVDTIITLISEATLSPQQPPQTQPKRSKIKRILKKSNKPETQVDIAALDNRVSRLEKKVNAMSRFNIQAAIDKSIEARIKKNDLLKDVPDFHKLKQEKSAKKSMPKSSTTSFDESSLDEYDHKNKLLRLILSSMMSLNRLDATVNDTWFNEMVNADKNPRTFEDVIGSIINFINFTKNCLKKDKVTKSDLEGLAFKLMKGRHKNYIELEYNFEHKPLALHGALGHLTIPVDFFFNKYLEYLTNRNAEKKYATSLTKPKAAMYDLEGIEQMIPKLWGSFNVAYDKDAAFRI